MREFCSLDEVNRKQNYCPGLLIKSSALANGRRVANRLTTMASFESVFNGSLGFFSLI